jgi:hypothetical protein
MNRCEQLQHAKQIVLNHHQSFDQADDDALTAVLARDTAEDYLWRGMHPFYEQQGAGAVNDSFWLPLRASMRPLQRRMDIFFAGFNDVDGGDSCWVCSAGHWLGLFDKAWLNIPASGRMTFIRYAEFHRIEANVIAETALFLDIPDIMLQAGCYPFPPATGALTLRPGPRHGDGLQFSASDVAQGDRTMALVNTMISDLSALNVSGDDRCSPALLRRTWHDDMIWYGPAGIGSTYTIERYQKQHQYPFRENLKDKVFNGHIARFAEGNFAGFFGWPNLTNTPTGGFMGLPGGDTRADMRVVDIYRREGDKLAENWVYIDVLHYLSMQGLDVLGRQAILNPPQG